MVKNPRLHRSRNISDKYSLCNTGVVRSGRVWSNHVGNIVIHNDDIFK